MSKKVGILGAGCAGLHLGLYLRKFGIDVTIITDRRPEQYASVRLLNTVAHHNVTIEREDYLDCNHWPTDQFGYFGHNYYVGGPQPLQFFGALQKPSRAVDYRLYLPLLMDDFTSRGGKIEYKEIVEDDVAPISEQFDLLVVCTGKGPFGRMFRQDPTDSPFDRPQRALCVGIFKGIAEPETRAVTMFFSPGAGEMIEIPTLTFGGMANALVIENHIGGELEFLSKMKYEDNPKEFMAVLLDKLRKHYPTCAERIDEKEFDVANSHLDLLQGGVTPVMRNSHVRLENGRLALALGDVQAVVDPVLGQGANIASYGALQLGEAIVENDVFDGRFLEKIDGRRRDRLHCATRWTNFMLKSLGSLSPDLLEYIGAISQNPKLADEFTDNFNYPERQWDCFSSPERMRAWVSTRLRANEEAGLMQAAS